MNKTLHTTVAHTLEDIRQSGFWKEQRVISSRQGAEVTVNAKNFVNFCSNNYLGLAGKQELVDAAKKTLDQYGFGLSSVRFICGTQMVHKQLEFKMANYFSKDDAIVFSSCWDANEAVFAVLLGPEDVVFSDELNHASIIDGMRLCKAEKKVFSHMDVNDLERMLRESGDKRLRCVVTDGVFSMDGDIAPLKQICDVADRYDAFVVVDDSHSTGFLGFSGRGSAEVEGVLDRVDIITTTFGKALGGASGGCVVGPKSVIDLLHQRARTALFSNSLSPVVTGTTLFVLNYIAEHPELREILMDNTIYFREEMVKMGFVIPRSVHPIVPIMIGEGKIANDMARDMLEEGIYVVGFSYPVVPKGKARIRVQISAAHTREQIDRLVAAFGMLARKYDLLSSRIGE